MTLASRAAVVATMAGGPATISAASATAPLPEGGSAVVEVGVNVGGGDVDRRVCDDVGRQRQCLPRRG